jgi:Flp pilus assembly protein TadB
MIGWLMLAGAVMLAWRAPPPAGSLSHVDSDLAERPNRDPGARREGGPAPPATPDSGLLLGRAGLVGASWRAPRGAPIELRPGRQRAIGVGAAMVSGLFVAAVIGGPIGIAAGLGAGIGLRRVLGRLEPGASRRAREAQAEELPVTLDLLTACLRAGSPLVVALEIVGGALPGLLGADLVRVAGMQRLGASPGAAWSVHRDNPVLAPVVRLVRRSSASGSALADAFERLAADLRAASVAAGQARAQRAAVYATAPLGLCFLPAFVLLTVVPLAASIAPSVLH